jgi:hypothetical protein
MAAVGPVLLAIVLAASMQAPQPSASRPPADATGLIVGRVVDGTTRRPVPGAIVTLGGGLTAIEPGRPAPAGPTEQPRAMTNASGQFVFRKLQKGAFTLTATKPGYSAGAYGRRRPGGSLATLTLDAGERVGDVSIPLWKLAAISGTVVDEAGEPLVGVALRAFQRSVVGGRRRLAQQGFTTTDDRGMYRFVGLAAGDYVVAFIAREAALPAAVAEQMRSPSAPNDPNVQALMRERAALGMPVGSPGTPMAIQAGDVVRQMDGSLPVPPDAGEKATVFIYPTQFYPGVPAVARAAVLTLGSGQERENVDFALRPVRASRITGSVIGPDGPVSHVAVRLVPDSDEFLFDLEASVTMTTAGGEFTLIGVPAGQYVIKVLRVPRPAAPPAPAATTEIRTGSSVMVTMRGAGMTPAPIPDDPTWYADVAVSVTDADVSGVVVPLQRGARLTGRIEFDGSAERPEPAALTRILITTAPADATPVNPITAVPPGRADESGTFKTYGLPPGRYFVRVNTAPPGWFFKSATSEGRDVSDTPLDLRAADVANVVVTFTDRPTRLRGVARTGAGNGDPDALVVVFPSDASAWSDTGANPRRLRGVRAGKDGAYSFTGLPAGDYYLAAIREEAHTQWQDPEVLEELSRSASHVRLADGETRTEDVRTVGSVR